MPELIRERREKLENCYISEYGTKAVNSKGRETPEEECAIRTCFQRDIDRITHSKSFRRLKHKTQVFLQPEGDHYRTRLTHTLEVSRTARTIARALMLNEDLTEAIALGHDLGHTPFGHAGERALNSIMGSFRHNEQSRRVVERVENSGAGLNLTFETRSGILTHSSGLTPATPEAHIVQLSDKIAYMNHDFDDALRAGILSQKDLPELVSRCAGETHSARINYMVTDIIDNSGDVSKGILMSKEMTEVYKTFRSFMFKRVYDNSEAKSEETKVEGILRGLWDHYAANPDKLPEDYRKISERDGLVRAICDYISGMTDSYALSQYEDVFIPSPWRARDRA